MPHHLKQLQKSPTRMLLSSCHHLLCCGQANAVSDKVLDLRKCDYTGKNLSGKTLAGALLSETNLSNTNLQEAVLTKVSHAAAAACSVVIRHSGVGVVAAFLHDTLLAGGTMRPAATVEPTKAVDQERLSTLLRAAQSGPESALCAVPCCAVLCPALLQSYAVESILEGADMTNAVVDRVDFSRAKLKGAKFVNAVVTGPLVVCVHVTACWQGLCVWALRRQQAHSMQDGVTCHCHGLAPSGPIEKAPVAAHSPNLPSVLCVCVCARTCRHPV